MNEDIRKKDVKAVGMFTFRQAFFIGVSLIICIPIGIWLPLDFFFKFLIPGILAIPIILCGWKKVDGQPIEIIAIRWIYKHYLTCSKRTKQDLAYTNARRKLEKSRKNEQLKKLSPQQRKQYERRQKKGNAVIYSKNENIKIYC